MFDVQFGDSEVRADFIEKLVGKDQPSDVGAVKLFQLQVWVLGGDCVTFVPDGGFDDGLQVTMLTNWDAIEERR